MSLSPWQRRQEHLCVRLSEETRRLLEDTKRVGGFASDAEVIRAALGLQHHLSRRKAEGRRVFLGDAAGRIESELLLTGAAG